MKKITLSSSVINKIKREPYYSEEAFINDAKCYIKAVKSGRIRYTTVGSVSASGMSRNIAICSYEGTMNSGYYRTYYRFLKALGHSFNKDRDAIRVSGCGMNMLFATNYNIIHILYRIGFINKKDCDILAQKVN